jgi:hypothetical protein
MVLTLVALSLLGDIAPGPVLRQPPPPPPVQCREDTDCVLSTFQGCCGGCCGAAPHGVPRGANEAAACAAVDCAKPDCAAVRCARPPDPGTFVPACRAGRCVALPKSAPPAQCRVNTDCVVVTAVPPAEASCHRSACGCCPLTQALPVDAAVPLQKRESPSAPPKKPGEKPPFGLSTGGPPPAAPNCSACPQPTGGTAACQSGQCVLLQPQVPRPEPRPRPPG